MAFQDTSTIDPYSETPDANAPQAPPERTPQLPQQPQDAANAQIPEEIQGALRDLMKMGERESDFGRRGHYREMLEAEEFWKGNQYPIWSEKEFNFRTPWDYAVSQNRLEDQPVYQYVINIYQSMGLTVVAALSQKVPKVRFFPHSTKSETDIATARAASDIAALIEKNNKLRLLAIREAYLLWTQGGFGTFTRFVRDKNKGLETVPIVEESTVPLSDDRYTCPACGYETPMEEAQATAIPGIDEMGQPTSQMTCPDCGSPMTDADFQAGEQATVPVISGYKEIPEGYEKMSVYGLLNIKLPPYVPEFSAAGYLQLVEDIHEGAVRASYFNQQESIGSGNPGSGDGYSSVSATESDTYERTGRMRLYDAPSTYSGMRSAPVTTYITYKRVWMRRWYLMGHPDPLMRVKLWDMFPHGVYCAFAGDKFLEARDEDVDDYWTICTAMPSYGIYPQAIGSSTIPLQKQINDAGNIVAEHLDYGTAPPVFYDAEFLSGEALSGQKMRPATFIPIVRQRGGMARNISELIHQPTIKIDSNIYGYGNSLIELVQLVSGALPSLFGGQLRGNETLGAYQQSRDQAMGKMQLFWAVVKQHHADTMRLGVECFKRNRTQDAERIMLGKSNDYTAKYIQIADLRGSFIAEPEADEDFPATWNEIRANFNELLQTSGGALASQILTEPANLAVFKKYLGSPAITFSAEANREMQFREIDALILTPPVGVPQMDPMTGMPIVDPMSGMPAIQYKSTVPPEVHAEDHLTHIKSIMEWVADPDGGILTKKDNPDGFANVMAHLLEHKEAMVQVAAFDMQLQVQLGLAPAPGSEPDGDEKKNGPPPPGK